MQPKREDKKGEAKAETYAMFLALFQQYFSANEQYFPLTTNQQQLPPPNFSETNCINTVFFTWTLLVQ